MALQGGPPISMQDLCNEFGVALPKSLYDFRRGGGIVPDVAANANVPTNFPIGLHHFYNATAAAVVNPLGSHTVDASAFGQPATASIYVAPDGWIAKDTNPGGSTYLNWYLPNTTGIGNGYYAKLVKNSGADTNYGGLALNTWYQLNTSRVWGQQVSTMTTRSGNFTLYIATAASDGAIVTSGTFTISASRED